MSLARSHCATSLIIGKINDLYTQKTIATQAVAVLFRIKKSVDGETAVQVPCRAVLIS